MAAAIWGVGLLVVPRSVSGLVAMVGAGAAVYTALNYRMIEDLRQYQVNLRDQRADHEDNDSYKNTY